MEGRQVKIKLAGSTNEYEVNLGLLRKHSAFFRKAFDESIGMKEAMEGCIELQDVSSEMLQTYLYWLYDRTILLPDGSDSQDMDSSNYFTFIELYNFADLYDTCGLRNDIVRAFMRYLERVGMDYKSVGATLRKLPRSSKFYAMLLAHVQMDLDLHLEDHCEAISRYFPREAIRILIHAFVTNTMRGYGQTEGKEWLEKVEL